MDLLSDVLRVARLTGGVFLRANFTAPWCIASQMAPEMCAPLLKPSKHLIQYHFIVEGSPDVCIAGRPETTVKLQPNEVVILPHNDVHHLGSDLSLAVVNSADLAVPTEDGMYQVTDGVGDLGERLAGRAQMLRGHVHPPAREVAHRRLADQPLEPVGKRRARQADLARQLVHRPRPRDVAMEQRQSA